MRHLQSNRTRQIAAQSNPTWRAFLGLPPMDGPGLVTDRLAPNVSEGIGANPLTDVRG